MSRESERVKLRTCVACGAQELTNASGMAQHGKACRPGPKSAQWRRAGKCPLCGKKALPYVMCPTHRLIASIRYAMNKGAAMGVIVKTRRGRRMYYSLGEGDAAAWTNSFNRSAGQPRLPRGFMSYAVAYLQDKGQATERSIVNAFTEYRRDRAARGHLESSVATEKA